MQKGDGGLRFTVAVVGSEETTDPSGESRPLKPFLKWPGGKRWLTQKYSRLFPTHFNSYIEPFLGGGATYLYLRPKRAILSDINPDVVCVYKALKSSWESLVQRLEHHQTRHSERYYYQVRDREPADAIERAARVLYLNRTCFNGIYRVNLRGEFNVPKGTKSKVVLPDDRFSEVSALLRTASIHQRDFEGIIDRARPKDFIFADPPYTIRHNRNGFIKYNETLFSWSDQKRLAEALKRAAKRGVHVICSNADHESVRALYDESVFVLSTVSRFSSISASSDSRRHFTEMVIRNRIE